MDSVLVAAKRAINAQSTHIFSSDGVAPSASLRAGGAALSRGLRAGNRRSSRTAAPGAVRSPQSTARGARGGAACVPHIPQCWERQRSCSSCCKPGSCSTAQGRASHVQSKEKLFFTLIALELAEGDIMFYINFIIITVITEFMYTKEATAP